MVVAFTKSVLEKCEVEDAWSPALNHTGVPVAFESDPKLRSGVKLNPPLPEPQAVPVLEMRPEALKVAQPGIPPAEDTTRLVVDAVIAERYVVVA